MAIGMTNIAGGASIKQIIPLEVAWTGVSSTSVDISAYGIDESKTIVYIEGDGMLEMGTWDDTDTPITVILPVKPIHYFNTVGAVHSLVIEASALRFYGQGGWLSQVSAISGHSPVVNVTLIEYYSGIKSLQRGVLPQTGMPDETLTIDEVDISKSIVIIDGYGYSYAKRVSTDTRQWRETIVRGNLSNSTTLSVEMSYPLNSWSLIQHYYNSAYYNLNGGNYSYQVVEFY